MTEVDDFNAQVIKEFRANAGKVGGFFEDKDLLLLHTTGAKTGEPRCHPLVCMESADGLYIIASAAGSPKHPAWFRNLVATPAVQVEYGATRYDAEAMVVEEPERSILYNKAAERYGFFAEYADNTAGIRTIPLILLKQAS